MTLKNFIGRLNIKKREQNSKKGNQTTVKFLNFVIMVPPIVIYPNNKEEYNLYKQLAKRLNNRLISKREALTEKERKFLDELSESIGEMRLYEEGKIDLKSARELLNEL